MRIKNKIKPKTRRRRNIVKKRLKRYSKHRTHKHSKSYTLKTDNNPNDKEGILINDKGKKTYPDKGDFDNLLRLINMHQWVGLITVKFHHPEYTTEDRLGHSSKRRFEFAEQLMKNLCNRWFGVKQSHVIWVVTEEFGLTKEAHIHIVFSFDNLNSKGLDRVSRINFSEDEGDFYNNGLESCEFLRNSINKDRRDKIRPNQIDFNWREQWDNEGLSRYMAKLEWPRKSKRIELHSFPRKESELLAG